MLILKVCVMMNLMFNLVILPVKGIAGETLFSLKL